MTDTPHYHGHRQRLREKFRENPRHLADYELLELLLAYALPRRDTKPMAKALLQRFETLAEVMHTDPDDLRQIHGLGDGASLLFALLQELRARAEAQPRKEKLVISHPSVVGQMAMARLGALKTEEVWAAFVDAKLRLMSFEPLSQGTVGEAPVYVREVLRKAIEHQAYGVFLVHNHPGGDASPSKADVAITRELVQAATVMQIRVLDHVIVTHQEYVSLQQRGLL